MKLQKEVTALRKSSSQFKAVKERAIASVKAKLLKEKSVHHEVISAVLHSAGIDTIGTVSRPSVAHILHKGYFAAQIQLGYEMQNAKSVTFSTGDTSHRSINYNSRHIHLLTEDYAASSNPDRKKQATHFLGIQSTCTVLRFVLFVPALLYAMFDYYVFILTFVLAWITSSLLDDTL